MSDLIERSDFVREAQRLRAKGWLLREIADHFSVAISTASAWLSDPDLSKQRERRKRYQGSCEDCGGATDGSNGRAETPRYCRSCWKKRREARHGTVSRWRRGCGCDRCREAHRTQMASLKGKPVPNHGTESGYQNYGCRCDACREAHRKYGWQHPEYKARWEAKVRGTEPPRHGYSTAYNAYGCRCEECRAWQRARR